MPGVVPSDVWQLSPPLGPASRSCLAQGASRSCLAPMPQGRPHPVPGVLRVLQICFKQVWGNSGSGPSMTSDNRCLPGQQPQGTRKTVCIWMSQAWQVPCVSRLLHVSQERGIVTHYSLSNPTSSAKAGDGRCSTH
ncbi:hypothetical protein HJG60_012011 [Phyllostomus discolor]|uniref:Uncharacterized protein n=1 Tax=Phyllostomus discolor TaxID=89673 RepID=A0A834DW63_9CHIR|nr:hypothetical protein HJG60_012011 [Phyllostomus discolor]